MMRVSPLGIFGTNCKLALLSDWAQQYAALTHPHGVCLQANALFAMAIARAIGTGKSPEDLCREVEEWTREMKVHVALMKAIVDASTSPPADYLHQQGWVLIAFQNALYHLLHAANLENGIVDTVMRGGDTDTNAAIAGPFSGLCMG